MTNQRESQPQEYEALSAEWGDPVLRRVLRICDPGRAGQRGFTFLPEAEGNVAGAWETWMEEVFKAVLLERMVAVMDYAGASQAREAREIDWELDALLDEEARKSSAEAGGELLDSLTAAHGVRIVNKFEIWQKEGETPAHFAVVYAIQCAVFNFPMRQSLLSYLRHEWRAATLRRCEMRAESRFLESLVEIAKEVDSLLSAQREFLPFHSLETKAS